MKSIEVTYDTEVWNGEAWETGEAATKLEFLDDDTVNDLVRFQHAKPTEMDPITYMKWEKLEQSIRTIEFLRRRGYIEHSIKSIKVIESQGANVDA